MIKYDLFRDVVFHTVIGYVQIMYCGIWGIDRHVNSTTRFIISVHSAALFCCSWSFSLFGLRRCMLRGFWGFYFWGRGGEGGLLGFYLGRVWLFDTSWSSSRHTSYWW